VKILIIRFSSIGDIVLTSPALRCLKEQLPEVEIHYLTKAKHSKLVHSYPSIHKVHEFKDDLRGVVKSMRGYKFDYIIDLHNNNRSNYVSSALKAKTFKISKLNILKWLLTSFHINRMPHSVHVVDRIMDTLKPLNIKNDGKGLDYFIKPSDHVDLNTLPEAYRDKYVAFIIGGTYETKRLPAEKILSVIHKLAMPVVLIGGEVESGVAFEIIKSSNQKVYNACGVYNIGQSASLIQQSAVVISNDTGMMHIAAALKKPIVAIWGNTVTDFGMKPYYGDHNIKAINAEVEGLKCRPCSKLGYDTCPRGHFKCMEKQSTTFIADSTKSLI
jgi:heptosyltransferase-2